MRYPVVLIAALVFINSSFASSFDCKEHIKKAVCVTGPNDKQEGSIFKERKCLGNEEFYISELIKVHDDLPSPVQKIFCQIKKIYIETDMKPTAYTDIYYKDIGYHPFNANSKKLRPEGFMLGLNQKRIFEQGLSASQWMTFGNYLTFGLGRTTTINPNLPEFDYYFGGFKSNNLLFIAVVHEMGHMIDYANKITKPSYDHCEAWEWKQGLCKANYSKLWASISWNTDGTPNEESNFTSHDKLCFGPCENYLEIENSKEMYQSFLEKNSFMSLYAAMNPMEDFAESFLYYMLKRYADEKDGMKDKFVSLSMIEPGRYHRNNLLMRMEAGPLSKKMEYVDMLYRGGMNYHFPKDEIKYQWVGDQGK